MDESFYRTLLHERAMAGWEVKWVRNISISAGAGALTTASGVGTTPMKTFLVSWAFTAALFALWEAAAFFRRRYYSAPYAVYLEQQQLIAGEEAKVDGLRKMLEASQADNLSLQQQLRARRKSQELADYLTERHAYGIREILCKPPTSALVLAIEEWRRREDAFTKGVLAEMRARGCTNQEIHHVEYIGGFTPGAFSTHDTINRDLSMFKVRLDRIADISTKHAPD